MPRTQVTFNSLSAGAVTSDKIASGAVTSAKTNFTDLTVAGNLTVQGNLTAFGDLVYLDTAVSVTSALSVINVGTGPALVVQQKGVQPIAEFYDQDSGTALFIDDAGKVSIGTRSTPATLTVAGTLSTINTFSVQQTLEKTSLSAGPILSDINFNLLDGSILYNLSASRTVSWSINLRGNASTTLNSIMSPGQTMTCVHLVSTATVSVYCSAVRVDGNLVIPRWQAGSAPNSGNLNGIDSYSFSVIKLDNALFQVLASQTQFS